MANKDVVFVELGFNENIGMGVLEWIFDHFEIEETSLVLPNLYSVEPYKSKFTEDVENKYLPRCIEEKFEAKILIPQGGGNDLLLELINKHGMTKLITDTARISDIVANYAMNLSCRIWGIRANGKKLVFIRDESVGEMEMREYLPNEDGLHKQNPLQKNKVFIALGQYSNPEKAFDWIFQNFEEEKTKIVITALFTLGDRETKFIKAVQSKYLPTCQRKKFEAEMLVPHAKEPQDTTLELITKHGMERLVISTFWLSYVLEDLGAIPNNTCMIWVLNEFTGKLVHFRDAREIKLLQKENDMHQQKIERRHLSKEYEDLLIEKPQSNEKIEEKFFADSEVTRQNLEIALKRVEDVRDMLQEEQVRKFC